MSTVFKNLFQTRDELSLRNLRRALWPLILIFPLTVIMGDLRYFNLGITALGLESWELMLFPLGLGWLLLVCIPKRLVNSFLCTAAVLCAAILPFQFFVQNETAKLAFFMAFQLCNGLCAACAFSLFCFELNNVERLSGMALIQLYYGFYYTVWRAFPAVQAAGKTWAAGLVMALYLVVVFACARKLSMRNKMCGKDAQTEGSQAEGSQAEGSQTEVLADTAGDGKGSAVPFVIGLDMVYYMIMCMINYIEWAESSVSSLAFGLGSAVSVALIIIILLLNNRSTLYIWLLFITLSLLGLGAIMYDSPATQVSGSFAYGLGDGLGYIIIYYICGMVMKHSRSFKMFRLYCLMFFVQYFVISGAFSLIFKYFEQPHNITAFAVVLVLSCVCLLLVPRMQKKLFGIDWTGGPHLRDMAEYSAPLAEAKTIEDKEDLKLTPREHEIFTMLLTGRAPKEIAYSLNISYDTVLYHQKKLYRKLKIQSRAELFARYQK